MPGTSNARERMARVCWPREKLFQPMGCELRDGRQLIDIYLGRTPLRYYPRGW